MVDVDFDVEESVRVLRKRGRRKRERTNVRRVKSARGSMMACYL